MTTCPDCNGSGRGEKDADYTSDSGVCMTCRGLGDLEEFHRIYPRLPIQPKRGSS